VSVAGVAVTEGATEGDELPEGVGGELFEFEANSSSSRCKERIGFSRMGR